MNYRPFIPILLASTAMISSVCAQEIITLEKIQVAEDYTVIDERRDNSIAKRIINGEELTQYGDVNALEILRRTPGVTIPAGKRISSAPGKGYTVVMIDGEETSTSTSLRASPLEQISPDMIEKIEVMTNGSAEHTAESMGGIVNIVLKKPKEEGLTSARVSLGEYGNSAMESLFAQREGKSGNLSYLINVNGSDNRKKDTASTLREDLASTRNENRDDTTDNQSISLGTKIIYTSSSKDKYLYSGSISRNYGEETIDAKTYLNGLSVFDTQINSKDKSNSTMIWSGLSGEHHLSGEELLEWKLKLHQNTNEGETTSLQSLPTLNDRRQKDYGFNRIVGAEGIYSLAAGDHFIKSGVDLRNANQRDEVQRSLNGVDVTTAADTVHMRENKGALYLQDEINFGGIMVVTPGIRYEALSRNYGMTSKTDYFAPSLHFLTHLSANDNLRASVAKTVRLPRLGQLSSSTNSSLDSNNVHRPDITGNPNLTEEKALSYELKLEHFFEDKGIVSIGGSYRNIDDKIENMTVLEGSRYVMRPYNSGQGNLWGVELELKKSLNTYVEGLGMFANATLQNSSLTNTATGFKRPIKQTSDVLYNLGVDHTLKAYKFTYGAAYRYVGGYTDPLDENGISEVRKGYGTLDLYASKRLNSTFKCQLNLKNITRATVETTSNYYDGLGALVTQIDKEHSKPQILLTLEGKW